MSNMSYCRYRNTLTDLRDCYEHMNEEPTSNEEDHARARIIELCQKIVDEYGDDET